MIPQQWYEERAALGAALHRQSEKGYVLQPDEAPVTDEQLEALAATPATAGELASVQGRGEYREGDTRGFVMAQEQQCVQYNCWMLRAADGSPRYVSERTDSA